MLESLFLLLPISVFFVLLIGVALWWAIFSGQFDNLNEAAHSILEDDDSMTEEDVAAQQVESTTADIATASQTTADNSAQAQQRAAAEKPAPERLAAKAGYNSQDINKV